MREQLQRGRWEVCEGEAEVGLRQSDGQSSALFKTPPGRLGMREAAHGGPALGSAHDVVTIRKTAACDVLAATPERRKADSQPLRGGNAQEREAQTSVPGAVNTSSGKLTGST